ncbi:hypothetical protein SteCoe_8588 [Stentor coeruleus]|uniref:Uncharacterized protein n=1 Tax=Stentor coeruleus TaxID=5963 RepID=A0A1R2CJY5_9CILI|nr:hypothetical protein SteCoe_8588 [Stentor coeruleus]
MELNEKCKPMLISGTVAGVFGLAISFIVNSTLAEISASSFFSTYFGLLFIILGGVIFCRVQSQTVADSRKKYFLTFGFLIILSGIMCFILEENWFIGMHPSLKIPLYGILGISVSYALTFAVVDLINYTFSYFDLYKSIVIENTEQIIAVISFSALMGLIFGVIYGIVDYEDSVVYHHKLNLMKEEMYCYPIGICIGIMCGIVNEYLRKSYMKRMEGFDDEI